MFPILTYTSPEGVILVGVESIIPVCVTLRLEVDFFRRAGNDLCRYPNNKTPNLNDWRVGT